MAYEDDFYIRGNIIGYTGALNNAPTVYFAKVFSDALLGKKMFEFGRITQDHPHRDNMGRNKVRYARDYAIYNLQSDNQEYAAEFYQGDIRHRSRNPFIQVHEGDPAMDALAAAIARFPDRKPK
ncbi:hypothetical protein [Xanthomonas sacchari]|uniref:hypothetical protein n=1 Tax=Xanthomonas sacchari TaxID=56458 RepID=UPI003B2280C9